MITINIYHEVYMVANLNGFTSKIPCTDCTMVLLLERKLCLFTIFENT